MNWRKYNNHLPVSMDPIIPGETATAATMKDRLFIAVAPAPNNHVLSEAEWSEVIGDNILRNGRARTPKSPYKISELRIFNSPFSDEAIQIMQENGKGGGE